MFTYSQGALVCSCDLSDQFQGRGESVDNGWNAWMVTLPMGTHCRLSPSPMKPTVGSQSLDWTKAPWEEVSINMVVRIGVRSGAGAVLGLVSCNLDFPFYWHQNVLMAETRHVHTRKFCFSFRMHSFIEDLFSEFVFIYFRIFFGPGGFEKFCSFSVRLLYSIIESDRFSIFGC